jgi:enamine deaminase RidA (YjgF/YER057c/UK114 family)
LSSIPSSIETRLTELGLELPPPPRPIAAFVPFTRDGTTVYLAGQVNELSGVPTATGRVPDHHDIAAGHAAARVCALNLLACLKMACDGDLGRVERCLSVRGFVSASPGFDKVPMVVNGASELFMAVLGEQGRHARTAIGVSTLPQNALVEVDAIFRIRAV